MTDPAALFKVLLVEDNSIYRDILKHALLKRFPELVVFGADSGDTAIDIIDIDSPDLVFMDINLKAGLNGLDLTRKVKAEHSEIKIFILSQHDTPEYRNIAVQNGADDFLPKSTSLLHIFQHVDETMKNKTAIA